MRGSISYLIAAQERRASQDRATTYSSENVPYLRSFENRDASERRLGKEFRRLAVARVVELRYFQLHTVVFRSDEDLEGAEVRGVRPQLLLADGDR